MASNYIYDNVDPNANIIFGALVDEKLGDKVRITVLATGFDNSGKSSQMLPLTVKKDTTPPPPPKKETAVRSAFSGTAGIAAATAAAASSPAPAPAALDDDLSIDEPLPATTPRAPPKEQPAVYQQPPPPPPPQPRQEQPPQDQSFLKSFRRM